MRQNDVNDVGRLSPGSLAGAERVVGVMIIIIMGMEEEKGRGRRERNRET